MIYCCCLSIKEVKKTLGRIEKHLNQAGKGGKGRNFFFFFNVYRLWSFHFIVK